MSITGLSATPASRPYAKRVQEATGQGRQNFVSHVTVEVSGGVMGINSAAQPPTRHGIDMCQACPGTVTASCLHLQPLGEIHGPGRMKFRDFCRDNDYSSTGTSHTHTASVGISGTSVVEEYTLWCLSIMHWNRQASTAPSACPSALVNAFAFYCGLM